jgi:cell division protein FtsB
MSAESDAQRIEDEQIELEQLRRMRAALEDRIDTLRLDMNYNEAERLEKILEA